MDKTPETSTHNKPEAEVKSGAVVASIWKNEGPTGPYRTVALTRFYKDRDEKWQRTKTLRPKDMPDVAIVSVQVTEKLAELGRPRRPKPRRPLRPRRRRKPRRPGPAKPRRLRDPELLRRPPGHHGSAGKLLKESLNAPVPPRRGRPTGSFITNS